MRTITFTAVTLAMLLLVGGVYTRKAAQQRETRLAFVRDSVQKVMAADSARRAAQADSIRMRMANDERRFQTRRDSIVRRVECQRRDVQLRINGVERVLRSCP